MRRFNIIINAYMEEEQKNEVWTFSVLIYREVTAAFAAEMVKQDLQESPNKYLHYTCPLGGKWTLKSLTAIEDPIQLVA